MNPTAQGKAQFRGSPGPWTNNPTQPTIWANDGDVKIATIDDLPWIESASGRRCSDWMTEQANAALIASAPDLLAACQALVAADGDRIDQADFFRIRDLAVSAVAKAIGGMDR